MQVFRNITKTGAVQLFVLILLFIVTGRFMYLEYTRSRENDPRYDELTTFFNKMDISSMVIADGHLIAGGKDGVVALDTASLEEVELNGPRLRYVRAIIEDSSGRIWIGHEDGLTMFDNDRFLTYTTDEGLPDNRVCAIAENKAGQLIVGTHRGASYWDERMTVSVQDGLTTDYVNVIFVDDSDNTWFGSYLYKEGGVSIFSGSEPVKHLYVKDGLLHSHITSVIQDDNGKIWVGTGFMDEGGASIYERVGTELILRGQLTKSDGLAGEKVRSLFQDSRGIIWIGSEYDGIALFQYSTNVEEGIIRDTLTVEKGMSHNEVKTIAEDHEGNIWLGTKAGITFVDNALMEEME